MRTVTREFARRLAWTVMLVTLGLGVAVAAGVRRWQVQWWEDGRGLLPSWVLLGVLALTVMVAAVVVSTVSRSMADQAAETVADPLRQLAHRTDEMASGGFALDPHARPGRVVTPAPWRAGIPEIDAVAREIDRHHGTFARALTSERSFAADASHQLRTPLAALLLRLEEIAQCDDAAAARAEADIAIAQVERLTGVVDELLQRTRAGHASGGAVSSVDVVLSGLDEEWLPAFTEAGRQIELTTERGVVVQASASALSQVLNALVENALAHGRGTVRVHVARSGPSAVFTVTDEGPGIPQARSRVIFDRAVTGGSGTGLGLAVARETAEGLGGRLELVQTSPPVFAFYVALARTP